MFTLKVETMKPLKTLNQSKGRNPIYYKISRGFPTYKCDFRFKSDIDDLVLKFGFKSETGDLNE